MEELETGSVIKTFNTVVVLNPNKYTASATRICDICQEFTGKQLKITIEKIGTKELAYPIKGTHIMGYFLSIYWMGTTENVAELERQMRIDDNVLKFMTVRADDDEYKLQEFAASEEESEQDVSQDAWDKIFN